MKVLSLLRSLLSLAVLQLVLLATPARGFREMATVLESFLQNGGWVVAAGKPFAIQSIFRYKAEPVPDLAPGMVGMPAPTPLCVDDRDGQSAVELKVCYSNVANQLFTFNSTSYALQSFSKPTQCLTVATLGMPGATTVSTSLELTPCDFYDANQKFMYNYFTYQWLQAQPAHRDGSISKEQQQPLCIDDGGATSGDAYERLGLADCKPFGAPAQTLMTVPDHSAHLPEPPVNGTPKLFAIGFPFRLRLFSSFLCVADNDDGEALGVEPCVFNPSTTQTFAFDTETSHIRSVAKPWLCLHAQDGGGSSTGNGGDTPLILQQCVDGDRDQTFAFDESTGVLSNPHKPGFCVDTNGPRYPEKTPMALRACHEHNWNQIFTVEGVSPLPPPVIPARG